MVRDVLTVLNDLIKQGVISTELLPDVISRYSELKADFEMNPYSEGFRQVMKSVDSSFLGENMIPSSEILLLGAAINLVKIEKAQQSKKIDFFNFLPSMGMKKCSKCGILNITNARFCYSCGNAFKTD
jgi:hypothetical protein